jgi:hypothetical protein
MKLLKIVIAAGGIYEILMGLVMVFFIRMFFGLLGSDAEITLLIFPRSMGVLAITFGALMLAASFDPERLIIIPLVSIVLRILIQFPIIGGCFEIPAIALPLVGFGAFDLIFGALTAYAIYRSGINWRNWRG